MKTKIIPFDLETAKKIQTGEISGKILYNKAEAEIVDFNVYLHGYTYICAKTKGNFGEYVTRLFTVEGKDPESSMFYKLELEVINNEPKFKPFDKVLVRDDDDDEWETSYFSHIRNNSAPYYYIAGNIRWMQCIPYKGNEHLVGTTDKPK